MGVEEVGGGLGGTPGRRPRSRPHWWGLRGGGGELAFGHWEWHVPSRGRGGRWAAWAVPVSVVSQVGCPAQPVPLGLELPPCPREKGWAIRCHSPRSP